MTEADEGLAPVFDGNTDFVCDSTAKASQIAAVTASTCVQAAFQLHCKLLLSNYYRSTIKISKKYLNRWQLPGKAKYQGKQSK